MKYPKSSLPKKSHNTYIVYIFLPLVCLFLALHIFPAGVPAAEPKTDQQAVKTLSEHTNTVTSVAFNPDGTLLASGSLDGTIKLWNPTIGEKSREVLANAAILAIAFSSDGKTLASGASDGTVKLWDPETGQEVLPLKGQKRHKGQVLSVAFSPDGKLLASSSWPVQKGFCLAQGPR